MALDFEGGRNYVHRLNGVRGSVCVGLGFYRYPAPYFPTVARNSTAAAVSRNTGHAAMCLACLGKRASCQSGVLSGELYLARGTRVSRV